MERVLYICIRKNKIKIKEKYVYSYTIKKWLNIQKLKVSNDNFDLIWLIYYLLSLPSHNFVSIFYHIYVKYIFNFFIIWYTIQLLYQLIYQFLSVIAESFKKDSDKWFEMIRERW